ncbi:MAG: hypothetical protein PUE41_08570, partial [bacterium]|nr:hypothetical protein [bacterium]
MALLASVTAALRCFVIELSIGLQGSFPRFPMGFLRTKEKGVTSCDTSIHFALPLYCPAHEKQISRLS